jgi:hypothetical protein
MLFNAVPCTSCGCNILIDGSKVISVGGRAMAQGELQSLDQRQCEIICPDCRCTMRFSDREIIEVDSTAN